jgi:hypothetical protein
MKKNINIFHLDSQACGYNGCMLVISSSFCLDRSIVQKEFCLKSCLKWLLTFH